MNLRKAAICGRVMHLPGNCAITLLVLTASHPVLGEDFAAPRLPAKCYEYTTSRPPGYVDKAMMRELDNTPKDNPLTDAGATLGRVLFYDKQLSKNNTIACASCHKQERGFADPRRFSIGYKGGLTPRNAMSLVNLRYTKLQRGNPGFFWDERAATLEEQVLMPIQDKVEMGMTLDGLEAKLQKVPYYPPLFKAAFGTPKITSDRIAMAAAQFLRSMVSFDSKFDRGAKAVEGDYSRDFPNFSAAENLGKSLFIDGVGGVSEIGCAHCHVPPTFAMRQAANNGLDLKYKDKGLGARNVPPNEALTFSNDGKFKASPLRNVALSGPFMHDGRFKTLEQVIDHYSGGVHPHPNLGLAFDEKARVKEKGTSGFRYTDKQKAALVAFLKTLTDEKFVSDPRFADPFVIRKGTGEGPLKRTSREASRSRSREKSGDARWDFPWPPKSHDFGYVKDLTHLLQVLKFKSSSEAPPQADELSPHRPRAGGTWFQNYGGDCRSNTPPPALCRWSAV